MVEELMIEYEGVEGVTTACGVGDIVISFAHDTIPHPPKSF